jgi:hypothetical protein
MTTELHLDLPWVPEQPLDLGAVRVSRDAASRLTFDDGIELEVVLLHPPSDSSAEHVVGSAREAGGPGRVVLVVGPVPVGWRASLREAGISWLATDGRMELRWPRVIASAHRVSLAAGRPRRRRNPLPLQKRQGLVAQELCRMALGGELPSSIHSIARATGIDDVSVSTACTGLAKHGYMTKEREGRSVLVSVPDVVALASLVANRTGWGEGPVVWAHGYGRSALDLGERTTAAALRAGLPAAITGRAGATFLGIVGTGEPRVVRIRAEATVDQADEVIDTLGLVAVDADEANVAVALDRWALGTTGASTRRFGSYEAMVASPMRVWCDLQDEPRGLDFASDLWEAMARGR